MTVGVQDFGFRRDVDPAHRVVDGWVNVDGEEWRVSYAAVHPRGSAKGLVVMLFNRPVPGSHRGFQASSVDADLAGQFFQALAMFNQADLMIELNRLHVIPNALVKDHVGPILIQTGDGR